jgi:sulfate transport system substrate-binding protein
MNIRSRLEAAITIPLLFALLLGGMLAEILPTTNVQAQPPVVKRAAKISLLNVSYDPTREFYAEFNRHFADSWKKQTGQEVVIDQSHGGSGKQARAVIDGLEADMVTLALALDIEAISRKGFIKPNWQARLPHNSAPYSSTIVFLVRKGNPKRVKDWDDLVRDDIATITANPKTGGGARWNYLAAWGYILNKELGDLAKLKDPTQQKQVAAAQEKARLFVKQLYQRVPVLDSAARGATNTFIQREIGDVLICWENEAFLAVKELGSDKVDLVVPSISILAEPPVAVVDKNVDRHGTREAAEAYLKHLYSPEGQRLAAKHYYRPLDPATAVAEKREFTQVKLFSIDRHFIDGATFDQIYQPR